jgi:tRNA-2-methylthio-N6-dimethylallyladenosine synthase
MAQSRGGELIDQLPDVDLVLGTQKTHRAGEYLDALLSGSRDKVVDTAEEAGSESAIREHLGHGIGNDSRPVTAFVSIMQGCNQHCTFCIVPSTRGEERSRPMDDIVTECRELASRGVREITLLGQIVTSYGRRTIPVQDGRSAFVQLIEAVHAIEGIERIRFTSPHPKGYGDDLVEAYGRLPKLVESAHLPVQSGSNRLLKLMHRGYTRERFLEIIAKLRAVRPDIGLSTDIIVGFPGETEEDFQELLAFLAATRFDRVGIFKYSKEEGTKAAKMDGHLPDEVKADRYDRAMTLLQRLSQERGERFVGRKLRVLVESPGVGRSEGDAMDIDGIVKVPKKFPVGEFADVTVTGAEAYDLIAK